jgi:hypothetical protein
MKKLIIPFLLSGLIFTAGTQIASAQVVLKEVTISVTASKVAITKKVSESFDRLFKGAVKPIWYKADKRFIVNFILDDQKHKAEFTKGGQLLYVLVYGNEEHMPQDVRTVVKSKYFDYNITSTVKIDVDGKTIWLVNIEDARQFYVLRVEDGDMSIMNNFKKS